MNMEGNSYNQQTVVTPIKGDHSMSSRITLHTLQSAPEAARPFLENAQKNSGFIPTCWACWPTPRRRWKPT